ncbi:MAG TPA: VWA domain-containing protein [Steroidobacteraceae bacterium]|nr:VWA domain-containing protein [Steroidobacteraceae bacterium]
MIHFEWPWMALLLPLPLVSYALRTAAEPRGSALYLPFAATVTQPAAAPNRRAWWRRLWYALIWILLLAAAMRPQWLGTPLPAPTSGRGVLLAVDVSGSMAIQDMAGGQSRLQVVQEVAGQFIDERRGDRVGLILFGTRPYLQAPLTTDLETVHRFLEDAVVGVAGTETAIGDAIGLAIKRLRALDGSGAALRHTVMILLTDGQNDAGVMTPLEAARMAGETGLRIYTIGVGAAAGSGLYGLSAGNTDLDEGTLKSIAQLTGGAYFRATDATALEQVYQRIDDLEPTRGREQWLRPRAEWFIWPLGLALLLSIPAAYLGAGEWA